MKEVGTYWGDGSGCIFKIIGLEPTKNLIKVYVLLPSGDTSWCFMHHMNLATPVSEEEFLIASIQ
tara:strand:+ start:9962 stop:10156 length:195 start_codon:yes stop_codon:yes gene_type:complete